MQKRSTLEKGTMLKEDVWVPTTCVTCQGGCGMLVHRVNGVVVDIKGDPNHPSNWGKLCAKGYSAIMTLYDPYRVKTPLKRTNPEKGLGVDAGWATISWDEALDILQKELTRVRKEDPRKLSLVHMGMRDQIGLVRFWTEAFETPNLVTAGYFCGCNVHAASYLVNGTFRPEYDQEHCNYLILMGTHYGFGVGHDMNIATQKTAEARKRGMKVVVVDPYCSPAAAKADEWLPIRPGTDGALVLSIINVLLNELDIYDREFIKKHTNGPYLVKADGYYVRREGKPVVWDSKEGTAKTFDAEVKDYAIEAIEGSYLVDGVECRPAFHLLKEHVKKYTPEMAAEITTIPAATIRRIAEEFGKAAKIGSTIVVEGKEFPYRPANLQYFRGAYSTSHGASSALAMELLNQVVGNFYVPGGHRGQTAVSRDWSQQIGKHTDGLVTPSPAGNEHPDYYDFEVKQPENTSLTDLYPISTNRSPVNQLTLGDPETYKLPYQPEVMLTTRRNWFLSGVNHKKTAEDIKKYRFVVVFGTHIDEMAEFADLVLPDTTNLEEPEGFVFSGTQSSARGYWWYGVREPVVPPVGEARLCGEVLIELAERMGFLGRIYELFNEHLEEPYKLDPSQKYNREELTERVIKSRLGEEKGLEWFRENGWLTSKMTVDEKFPLPWLDMRFPIYYENFLRAGKEVKEVAESMGIKDWDVADYTTLPDWKPSLFHRDTGEFDLIAINFRVSTHAFSFTAENAWLAELAEFNPYAQKILINTETAKRKGIRDKDRVYVESAVGKVVGTAKVTECIHPEVVGISGHFGSLAKGKPIAYGKGANINNLLPFGKEYMDPVASGVDASVKVKVYKA